VFAYTSSQFSALFFRCDSSILCSPFFSPLRCFVFTLYGQRLSDHDGRLFVFSPLTQGPHPLSLCRTPNHFSAFFLDFLSFLLLGFSRIPSVCGLPPRFRMVIAFEPISPTFPFPCGLRARRHENPIFHSSFFLAKLNCAVVPFFFSLGQEVGVSHLSSAAIFLLDLFACCFSLPLRAFHSALFFPLFDFYFSGCFPYSLSALYDGVRFSVLLSCWLFKAGSFAIFSRLRVCRFLANPPGFWVFLFFPYVFPLLFLVLGQGAFVSALSAIP